MTLLTSCSWGQLPTRAREVSSARGEEPSLWPTAAVANPASPSSWPFCMPLVRTLFLVGGEVGIFACADTATWYEAGKDCPVPDHAHLALYKRSLARLSHRKPTACTCPLGESSSSQELQGHPAEGRPCWPAVGSASLACRKARLGFTQRTWQADPDLSPGGVWHGCCSEKWF